MNFDCFYKSTTCPLILVKRCVTASETQIDSLISAEDTWEFQSVKSNGKQLFFVPKMLSDIFLLQMKVEIKTDAVN